MEVDEKMSHRVDKEQGVDSKERCREDNSVKRQVMELPSVGGL